MSHLTDLKVLIIFTIVFWAFVWWWIVATDPLASRWNRYLFDLVSGILTCFGIAAVWLALTGLSADVAKRNKWFE